MQSSITAVVVLAAVALGATIVWAQATRATVQGDMVVTGYFPGREWWSDGILHMRDVGMTTAFTGDLEGTASGTVNNTYDPVTGSGEGFGTIALDVTWGDVSGTFAGRWTQKVIDNVINGQVVLHGSGGFAGMLMKGTFTTTWGAPDYEYELVILNPHGE
jgi:hypothetical protein